MIETLLHELTHEEQYFEKRLEDFNRRTATWNGDLMRVYWPGANSKAQQRYLDLPWEIEARERAAKHLLEVEQWTGKIPNDVV